MDGCVAVKLGQILTDVTQINEAINSTAAGIYGAHDRQSRNSV